MRIPYLILASCLFLPVVTLAANSEPSHSEPNNSLERRLLSLQQGEGNVRIFMDQLVDSEVVLLSKRNVVEADDPADISPLVLPMNNGDDEMVAVFTSPELAHRVAKTYPEYRYGIQTEFVWVLAHTSPGLGVAINPGWTLGMQIPSYGVLRMRERYAERIEDER